jgi:hypothetical protein
MNGIQPMETQTEMQTEMQAAMQTGLQADPQTAQASEPSAALMAPAASPTARWQWQEISYEKVRRDDSTYRDTWHWAHEEIARLVSRHVTAQSGQWKRLIRDQIDACLGRYHAYAIKERIGAHYFQADLSPGQKSTFEHLIPKSTLRDMLLHGALSIDEALSAPTVRLSSDNDEKLRRAGMVKANHEPRHPFRRYLRAQITSGFATASGEFISDPAAWSLEDHYRLYPAGLPG